MTTLETSRHPYIPTYYKNKKQYINTEEENSDLLIKFDEITYKNAHIAARQAWDFLALNIDDKFAKEVIAQRAKSLLDPNYSLGRAYSALDKICSSNLYQTGDRRWLLLSMGFATLAIQQVFSWKVARVYR